MAGDRLPCSYCAKSIIQAGIHTVVYDMNFPGNQKENVKLETDELSSIRITELFFYYNLI